MKSPAGKREALPHEIKGTRRAKVWNCISGTYGDPVLFGLTWKYRGGSTVTV
ncbi:MAG: hypothetical protein KKG84_01995 [Candidatus Omnitrophica bacterium]|nr:hypothetical protein [Candidatus Omnitrophota bacterium]